MIERTPILISLSLATNITHREQLTVLRIVKMTVVESFATKFATLAVAQLHRIAIHGIRF